LSHHEEKRRFKRILHGATGHLLLSNDLSITCSLLDISLNGCLLSSHQKIDELHLEDRLSINLSLRETLSIKALAHIAYFGKEQPLGLQFDGLDIHSATLLRRLVELNIGDTSLLERQLHSLSVLQPSQSA